LKDARVKAPGHLPFPEQRESMDSNLMKTVGLAAITTLITVFVARADGAPVDGEAGGRLAADTATRDSSVQPRWMNDANVLSLVSVMNQRQVAAADIELSAWRSDTVRALAASLVHEHSELQHSVDSAASALRVAPVASALNAVVNAAFQAQIDSMAGARGGALDRAFVRQQLASHKLMADYLAQLQEVASRPELRGWLESARAKVGAQIMRLQAQQTAFVVADSTAADSLSRRSVSRARKAPTR
jgi:predicted outer membrane protein